MLEKLYIYRTPIINVVEDRTIKIVSIAQKIESLLETDLVIYISLSMVYSLIV